MIGSQETRSFFLQKWLGKKITSRLKLKTWNFYIQKVSGRYRWRRHTCWSRWDPTRIGMAREPFSWLRKMSWVTLLCTVGPVYYYHIMVKARTESAAGNPGHESMLTIYTERATGRFARLVFSIRNQSRTRSCVASRASKGLLGKKMVNDIEPRSQVFMKPLLYTL